MPRKDITPAVRVGDKVVQVGPLSFKALNDLTDTFESLNLPLPNLDLAGVRSEIQKLQGQTMFTLMDLGGIVYEFVAGNLPSLYRWLTKSPPLVKQLIIGASNLTADEVDQLTAAEALRVAHASWQALVDDGFFAEIAGFFGGLLTTRAPTESPSASADSPPPAPADTAAA